MKKILLKLTLTFVFAFYGSLYAGTGTWDPFVIINTGGQNLYHQANYFNGTNLGTLTTLKLKGGELKTWKNNGANVTGVVMYWRVYKVGDAIPNYSAYNLPWNSDLSSNPGDQKWSTDALNYDLLSNKVNGSYKLEVFFKSQTTEGDIFNNNGGSNYIANFTIGDLLIESNTGILFKSSSNSGSPNTINFLSNGNVGIGTSEVGTNKLAVEGTIAAREVIVVTGAFPDYVFADDYKLMTLPELKKYITENKHLPNIPPAVEVEKSGLSLGEFHVKLLEKIEELTLYIIEQNSRIDSLEERLKEK